MTSPFRRYAEHYDVLYQDKDYAAEARFVKRLLDRALAGKAAGSARVLDLACGTGRHAQELARLGLQVEGSDISADMVAIARERSSAADTHIRFYNESFQTCDRIREKYDAVIAMFAAINYLTAYADLSRTLRNIRSLLDVGGVFLFDFWNGNAVIDSYSPTRLKRAEGRGITVVRNSTTELDKLSQVATVHFDFTLLEGQKVVHEFSEVHRIRYFFPMEMSDLLSANGFEVIHRCPLLGDDDAADPDTWNLTYVARPCE